MMPTHRNIRMANARLLSHGYLHCVRPCLLGDLYAMYFFYCLAKTSAGVVDILLSLPFLIRKPKDWYRLSGTSMDIPRPPSSKAGRWPRWGRKRPK